MWVWGLVTIGLTAIAVGSASVGAQPAVAGEFYPQPGELPVEPPAEVELLWPRAEVAGVVGPAVRRYQVMSFVLAAADFVALRARCPYDDLRARLECLDEPAVAEDVDVRLSRALVELALLRLDVELPRRVTGQQREAARVGCASALGGWLACAERDSYNAATCTPARRAIEACLARDDDVVEAYLDIVADKRAAFGRARFAAVAGVLAELPLASVAEASAACPQRDPDPLFACLQAQPASGAAARARARLIHELAGSVPALPGADVAGYRRETTEIFLSVPNLNAIVGACVAAQPELLEAPPAGAAILPAVQRLYACVRRTAETDPVANPAYIDPARMQAWLADARGKVVGALREAELGHQRAASRRIALAFALLAGLGFLAVAAVPRVWRRASAAPARVRLAAGVALALSLIVVGGAMLLMRELQGRLAADSTSPRTRIADGTFRVLEEPAFVARFSEASRHRIDLIKRPLREIVRADRDEVAQRYTGFALRLAIHWAGLLDEPELHARRGGDVAAAGRHGAAMRRTFGLYRVIDAVMALVPFLLALGTAVLYLWPLRATLRAIAAGTDGSARRARALVWGELRAVAVFLAVALALLPAAGWLLARTVEPLVAVMLTYALVALAYVGGGHASTAVLMTSLAATMLALALCVGLVLAAIGLYLGALRKALHRVFHDGQRFAELRRFWITGAVAAAGLIALPLGYALAVRALVTGPLAPDPEAPTSADLLLVPVGALVALPLLLWALRGGRALGFLRRSPRDERPAPSG